MIENTNAAENVIDTEYAEENLQLAENQYTEEEEIEQVENEFKSKRELLEKTKIVKQTWSILEIFQKIKDNKLILDPDYQRMEIWGIDKKTAFIESLFMEIMIPPIYVVEVPGNSILEENKYEVVDGKQRLTTIKSFLNNEFALKDKCLEYYQDLFKNKKFNEISDLYSEKTTQVLSSVLDIYVITANSPEFTKYDIFARLNKGAEKLKVNEIRRAIYRSSVTQYITDFVEHNLEDQELRKIYTETFTKNDIKRFEDYGRFYRSIAFFVRSNIDSKQVDNYNSRPRDMINEVLHEIQNRKIDLSEDTVKLILETTLSIKHKYKNIENIDYLIDSFAPFFKTDYIEKLLSIIPDIINDDVLAETFEKSPATTTNVNERLKRVCELMENNYE